MSDARDVDTIAVEMAGIEVVPVGSTVEQCEGAVVSLSRGEGGAEVRVSAALGPAQCREVARQLLVVADAASRGSERTLYCVTTEAMWQMPGQALIVRCTPDVHMEFAVKPPTKSLPSNVVARKVRPLVQFKRRLMAP